jgi:hypothetical protein
MVTRDGINASDVRRLHNKPRAGALRHTHDYSFEASA